MLSSNLWTHAGLKNGAGGKVIDFVYTKLDGPRSKTFTEAIVLHLVTLSQACLIF